VVGYRENNWQCVSMRHFYTTVVSANTLTTRNEYVLARTSSKSGSMKPCPPHHTVICKLPKYFACIIANTENDVVRQKKYHDGRTHICTLQSCNAGSMASKTDGDWGV